MMCALQWNEDDDEAEVVDAKDRFESRCDPCSLESGESLLVGVEEEERSLRKPACNLLGQLLRDARRRLGLRGVGEVREGPEEVGESLGGIALILAREADGSLETRERDEDEDAR